MELDGGTLLTSTASVIPVGGVHVSALVNEWDVTIMSLAIVVVTAGAACAVPLAVFAPRSISTGLSVSTPEKDMMPAAEPVEALKVHE